MVVYLDTSSLVKLYVDEEHSTEVAGLVQSSDVTATSMVAYAEARAAFARRLREKAFTPGEHDQLISVLNKDWGYYLAMKATEDLVRLAGDLAQRHALRGFDAIHLSSAIVLRKELSGPVVFSCSDRRLQEASLVEGLHQPN
ncbi:MAG: type II toxin-antitoxin system VapC family toxin [Thermodesulfobacteriota bacterium]|nr:type II toxin-antitoxin system VapC family toxin [Thermodesulfobacteriota bacterium]